MRDMLTSPEGAFSNEAPELSEFIWKQVYRWHISPQCALTQCSKRCQSLMGITASEEGQCQSLVICVQSQQLLRGENAGKRKKEDRTKNP